jgi:hypothetical protein
MSDKPEKVKAFETEPISLGLRPGRDRARILDVAHGSSL